MDGGFEAVGRAEEANRQARPVRIEGDVVARPSGKATPTIHAFLRFLRDQGLDCVPEPLGLGDGIELLRFLPGASGGDAWYHQHTDAGLASAARLLRRIHDASANWTPPPDATWTAHPVPAEDVVYCHGDPGPWNFVWHDDEAVGLIDWDYLHPGPRLDDVAYAARWFVPMRSDAFALRWHHFAEVPDRRHRTDVFLEAYGGLPRFDVVAFEKRGRARAGRTGEPLEPLTGRSISSIVRTVPTGVAKEVDSMKKWTRWQDWLVVAAGVVAAISTIWVAPMGASMVLMLAFGILLVVAGLLHLAMPELHWMEWVQGVLGVLLFISPWVARYATATGAAWFSWICGGVAIVVAAISVVPMLSSRSHHGGGVAHVH